MADIHATKVTAVVYVVKVFAVPAAPAVVALAAATAAPITFRVRLYSSRKVARAVHQSRLKRNPRLMTHKHRGDGDALTLLSLSATTREQLKGGANSKMSLRHWYS
jgi:hypothetical protein